MRFSTAVFASIFTAMAAAQNMFTMATVPTSISTGTTFNITWQATTQGTISLILVQASNPGSSLVHPVATIVANLTNSGAYAWLLPSSLPKGSGYAIEIIDDANINIMNYSGQFAIDSLTLATATAGSSTTAASVASTTTGSAPSSSGSSASGSTASTLTNLSSTTLSTKTTSAASTGSASTTGSGAFPTASKAGAAVETARSGMGLLAALGVAVLFL